MNKIKYALFGMILMPFFAMAAGAAEPGPVSMDLSGQWSFHLDESRVGERERWFTKDLKEQIRLPGSTDEQGFGVKTEKPQEESLTREYRYVGPAWYQKTIEIHESWEGRHVELFIERAMWETKVWLDGSYIGTNDSLCVPHRFDLSDYIAPGKHRLTLCIDNRLKINVRFNPRAEESQTSWNGAIGRLELRVTDPVWIERVEIYPDFNMWATRVVAFVSSSVGAVSGEVTVSASCGEHSVGPVTGKFRTKADDELSAAVDPLSPMLGDLSDTFYEHRALTAVEIILPFGKGFKLWDESLPDLYQLKIGLTAESDDKQKYSDEYYDTFGLRKFAATMNEFKLNDRTVFLEDNKDNCIYPKTTHPPMEKAAWLVLLKKYKDNNLDLIRFRSWCPPKAAFQAADELGMIVQVETPIWDGSGGVGHLPDREAFIRDEAERILDEYGNHPSFCVMSICNGLGKGDEHYMQYMVDVLSHRDQRHFYSFYK